MEFLSTRGISPPADLGTAVFRGLAPDGGLYMPRTVPRLQPRDLQAWEDLPWPHVADRVLGTLLAQALDPDLVRTLAREALNFPVPLVRLEEEIFVLELFRGPTLAFKDVGARFLARLLPHLRHPDEPLITILTATSGDTGGAVAQAFHGVPGTRVAVLFPDGKVTPRQERQFSTLGGNVMALAVQGDFDDCQRLAKEAFQAQGANPGAWSSKGLVLTSANSINVGRFLPQTTYYFHLMGQLRRAGVNRTRILVSVPSGNFGNLAAGLMTRAMGLDQVLFLAATNRNDVVPRYLATGRYAPRASVRTLSTAMDVAEPSNLDRILYLYQGDLESLKRDLLGRMVTDPETEGCIAWAHRETGYILDPHSAVAYRALKEEKASYSHGTGVFLATAHPAKFAEIVEPAIGSSLPVPPELAASLERSRRVVPVEPRLEAVREALLA